MRLVANNGIVLFALLLLAAYVLARQANDIASVAGAVWAGGAALVALGIGQIIGGMIDRARPYESLSGVHVLVDRTTDFSFPSDHATTVGAVAVGLYLCSRQRSRWIGIVAVVAALAMAVARVYVGAHYPGDVVAGLLLGGAVAAAGARFLVPLLARLGTRLATTPLRVLVARTEGPSRRDSTG